MSEYRPLLMRANRLLGANLVEHNLVKVEDLESANERLLELVNSGTGKGVSILGILIWEKKVLKEQDLLAHLVEDIGIGMVDLRPYDLPDELRKNLDPGACWATWSVPFDQEEDTFFVASAYYLSPAVRAYWEKQLAGPILWYATSLEQISGFLEKLEEERAPAPSAEAIKAG